MHLPTLVAGEWGYPASQAPTASKSAVVHARASWWRHRFRSSNPRLAVEGLPDLALEVTPLPFDFTPGDPRLRGGRRVVPEYKVGVVTIGRQFGEPWGADDRRLGEPLARFEGDRQLMLSVTSNDEIKGGVIASGDEHVTVRAIGIDADLRGRGRARLLEVVEAHALARGARVITLATAAEARGFHERLGYRGRRTTREKQLPPLEAVRERRVATLLEALGDVQEGIPALPTDMTRGDKNSLTAPRVRVRP